MADAVTTTTVIDGARTAVIYCTNTSDSTGEAAVTKVDVSALSSRHYLLVKMEPLVQELGLKKSASLLSVCR